MARATTLKKSESLVPQDRLRPVKLSEIIRGMAQKAADERASVSFTDSVRAYLAMRGIEGDAEAISRDAWESIRKDMVRDSEENQAYRALAPVLKHRLKHATGPLRNTIYVLASSWERGDRVTLGRRAFTLTGDSCPRCEVNPQAHGDGGGVRCVDIENCGWWYCA